ncbi:hypothetical protein C0995_002743 [Termitomyces sp. Mi166|nr:hypothetical protein C0995_002743 [Termitomyces sp. Mi166\
MDHCLVADQAWKAGTADSNDTAVGCSFSPSGACFTDRKLAAVRAYHEWMPIREVVPDDKLRIWRNFQIGKLLDLTMLDTRESPRIFSYEAGLTSDKDNMIATLPMSTITQCFEALDLIESKKVINSIADFKNRSLMGAAQEQWLSDTLSESKKRKAVWRVIGQQVVFSQLNEGGSFDVDAWDGYRANRARILDHLYQNKISNTVILAGDSHANWVSDLAHPNDTSYDPVTGEGAIGVEFAGTAVTSTSPFGANIAPAAADVESAELVRINTELQWSEGSFRGFFLLTIDSETLNATYYGMNNITFANLDGFPTAQFNVKNGQNRLSRPVAGGVSLVQPASPVWKSHAPLLFAVAGAGLGLSASVQRIYCDGTYVLYNAILPLLKLEVAPAAAVTPEETQHVTITPNPHDYPPPPVSSVSLYQLSFGTVTGICAGVFIKKGAKAAAWFLGGIFVLLQYLSSVSLVRVDWKRLATRFENAFHIQDVNGVSHPPSILVLWKGLLDFLTADFQPRASFIAGLVLGLRIG